MSDLISFWIAISIFPTLLIIALIGLTIKKPLLNLILKLKSNWTCMDCQQKTKDIYEHFRKTKHHGYKRIKTKVKSAK